MTPDSTDHHAQQLAIVPTGIQISERAQQVKHLHSTITRNNYGLPEYIFRDDLLPSPQDYEGLDVQEKANAQTAATVELDYSQGYACLPNGETFWSRLPHEPLEAYRAFMHFVEMPRNTSDTNRPSAPVRQLNMLKAITNLSSSELLTLSYQYYWPDRARAYDLFMIASHVRQKELRTHALEDDHFKRAQKYMDMAEARLDEAFEDTENPLTGKEAFDILFKMMQLQRLSVGLSPNGAHANKDENRMPTNAPFELILRTIAKNAGLADAGEKTASNLTQELMKDPKALEQAQELIIRMGDINAPRQINKGDHFEAGQ